MTEINVNHHYLDNATPICELNCRDAFKNLSPDERLYAHYIARACFEGALIIPLQVSPESAGIFVILYRIFSSESIEEVKAKATSAGLTDAEWQNFLVFTAGIFTNYGNYKGFGDSKFIPNVPAEKLRALVSSSEAAQRFPDLLSTYSDVEKGIFSLDKRTANLGFNEVGVTTYHSENVTKEDSDLINRYMKEKNLEGWNNRLIKEEINGVITFTIKSASIDSGFTEDEFEGVRVRLEKGDYEEILERVIPNLKKAGEYTANTTQKAVMAKFVEHFTTGELKDHRDASSLWIKDVNPVVESYLGFFHEYRDPSGVRAQWMALVAAVNKESSKKLALLVERAEPLLERLPWGKAYEKDAFLKPDFTALDIIAYGTSGVMAGYNIPHMYDDIRANEGFKNISFSNSIYAVPKQEIPFVGKADEKLLHDYLAKSFEVQVGLHELLGHGSGKLFQRNADGTFNFDKENTVDIVTGGKVTSWYEPGESWSSQFGKLAGGIEECRCEAVGYVLCCDEDILEIFGYSGEEVLAIKEANWLSSLHRGLFGLEFYKPELEKWGQAHAWARFILLKVLLEAGQGFVTIEETTDSSGCPDLSFKMDRSKIDSVGKSALMEFLKKLQGYKTTADVKGGTELFNKYAVNDRDLKWREICLAKSKPRRFFVQSNTKLTEDGNNVELVNYAETTEGVIQSVVERFSAESIADLEALWKADQKYFPSAYAKN